MRARIAASVVLAVGIVMGTAGCNMLAPQATLIHYDPSDGVSGTVGDIDVRNAILISDNGKTGNLVVTLVNNGDKPHRVLVKHGTSTQTDTYVTVEAGQVKKIGADNKKQVQLDGIDTKAGALYPVYFQYADKTGVKLLVPVLTSRMAEYKTYTPTPTPTPSSVPTMTPEPATN